MVEKREQLTEAEEAILGALLLDASRLPIVTQHVRADDFTADPRHRVVFEAIVEQHAAGLPVDEVTITSLLQDTGRAMPDAAFYLTHLVDSTATAANVEAYARLVSERAGVRRLYAASRAALKKLAAGEDAGEVMTELGAAMSDVNKRAPRSFVDGAKAVDDVVRKALARASGNDSGETFVATGLTALDTALGGLGPGLYVIGGRPRMGKTALAVTIADNIAWSGRRAGVFSAEMTLEEWVQRSIAARARVRHRQLRLGGLSGEEWERVLRLKQDFPRERLMLDEASLTAEEIVTRAEIEHERDPLAVVFVDYLQRVAPGGTRHVTREQQVADVARKFKNLSKRLRIPVVVLAQLNRGANKDPAERTTDADFRESDAIFAEGDVVMAVKRPIVWDPDADKLEAKVEIIKFRNGEESDERLDFEGWCTHFCDHDPARAYRTEDRPVSASIPRPPPRTWDVDT